LVIVHLLVTHWDERLTGADSTREKHAGLKRPGGPAHLIGVMDSRNEEESEMRVFVLFVLALLFVALGALEVVAARAVPLP
jgi:hypothetical protein